VYMEAADAAAAALAAARDTAVQANTDAQAAKASAAGSAQAAATSAALAATFNPANFVGTAAFTWANLGGKPATFTPAAHAHAIADVTGLQAALDGKQASGSYVTTAGFTWAALSGKPSTFASDWSTLANKPATYASDWSTLSNKPAAFAPTAHTHVIADVTGLQAAIDARLLVTTGVGGAGQGVWQQAALGFDSAVGDGLLNLVAGATHIRQNATSGTGHSYQGSRGASRIGLHDNTINLYVGSKASGAGQVAGETVVWSQLVGLAASGAQFNVNAAFPGGLSVGQNVATGLYGDYSNVAVRGYSTGSLYLQTQAGAVTNLLLEPTRITAYQPMFFNGLGTFNAGAAFGSSSTMNGLTMATGGILFNAGPTTEQTITWKMGDRNVYFYGNGTAVGLYSSSGVSIWAYDKTNLNMGVFAHLTAGAQVSGNLTVTGSMSLGGYTPWTNGNLAPMTSNTGQLLTQGVKEFVTVAGNVWQNAAPFNTYISTLGVRAMGGTGDSAAISFHRPGQFAAHFGLDHLNRWSVGGWSMGDVRKQLWLDGQIPTGAWQNSDDGRNRFWFGANGDSLWKTAGYHHWRNSSDSNVLSLSPNGDLSVNSNVRAFGTGGTGQFTAVIGNTMAGFYQDGTQFYILKNATSSTSFDSHRPLYVNLASGAVTLDGTGAGGVVVGGRLDVAGTLYANGEIVTPGWIRVTGSNGIYWNSFGGGWHMSDSTWMRSYGGKSIYTSGFVQADAGMTSQGGRVFRHADGAYANSSVTYSTAAPSGGADGDVWFQYS
ncbi:hypothetical protein, partial [Caulobacter sp. D4A]